MLLPNERVQAIKLLTENAFNGNLSGISYSYGSGSSEVKDLLMYGFKGFAQYTDKELLRALQTLAKRCNNFEVQNFISTISADKFMLE
jgi:hypothetical protein